MGHISRLRPFSSPHLAVRQVFFYACLIAACVFALPRTSHAQAFNSLFSFSGPDDGTNPVACLIQANDGNFYGTTYFGGVYNCGTVFRITTDGTLTTLHSFSGSDGADPEAAVMQANDGNLYGTTAGGGAYNAGTVFRITTDGTLTTLYSFTGGTDGYDPQGGLIQANDGNLYGTTPYGGANGRGTVFKITLGGTLTTLYDFSAISSSPPYSNSDGADPVARLIQGKDGNLYGTAQYGGANGTGTVFKLKTDGTGFQTVHSFRRLSEFNTNSDGANPVAGLIQGKDSDLYGTTPYGGTNGNGTVFKISTSGVLTTLYSFSGTSGASSLIQAKDGNLYGTTASGGLNKFGTVFKITTRSTLTTLYSFSGPDGANPQAALMQASDGNLYGTTRQGGTNSSGTIFKITTGGTLTTLYNFTGATTDGFGPNALMQANDANLYGTAQYGGANGAGTVFKITPDGTLTTLYSFTATDGASPAASLMQAKDGNLYGTTVYGGANNVGTVFQITTAGALTTLYQFSALDNNGNNKDGAYPQANLIQGKDGNLYGTTRYGGPYSDPVIGFGYGTVFEITPDSTGVFSNKSHLTTLYSFGAYENYPNGLIQARDGNLYGTTAGDGSSSVGTVFQITTSGNLTTLYSFFVQDGAFPEASLVQARDGNLYGTTQEGGAYGIQYGTVFRITTSSALRTLYSFGGPNTNGFHPAAALIQASDGNLYGTTTGGYDVSDGTVFRITTGGKLTTLYSFGGPDGANPEASLVQAGDGNLYSTTAGGGDYGLGTIYSLALDIPVLTSLSPSSADAAGPAFTLTLKGLFASNSAAQWTSGGFTTALTTTYVSGAKLTAVVPASLIANAGTATITVVNGSGIASNSETFTTLLTTLKLSSAKLTVDSAGAYTAKISLQNEGNLAAPGVTITAATLGKTATTASLPISLGTIAPKQSGAISLTFPGSAGAAGSKATLTISGTYGSGEPWKASVALTLP